MSVKIIKGEDRDITVQMKDGNGANLDLTQYASGTGDIIACFVDTGTAVTISRLTSGVAISGDPTCGVVVLSLSTTQTGNLDSDSKDFEIELVDKDTAKKRIVQIKGQLDIEEQIC